MTLGHALVYRNAIEWEQKRKLRMRGDSVLLGDSLLPEEYIVGKFDLFFF